MHHFKLPLVAQLEITDRCNYACSHCYNFDKLRSRQSFIDIDEGKLLYLAKYLSQKIFFLVVTGGEPLLRPKLMLKIFEILNNNRVIPSLNTNLQLLNDKYLKRLLKIDNLSMLISCPSSNADIYRIMTGGGDFSIFKQKLKLLLSFKDDVSINMVVNKKNLHLIRETASDLKALGVRNFGATPMEVTLNEKENEYIIDKNEFRNLLEDLLWCQSKLGLNIDIFEAIPKCAFPSSILNDNHHFLKRTCEAGRSAISVKPNGDVKACTHDDIVYGNLFEDSIEKIWRKLRLWRDGTLTPQGCEKCLYHDSCFGGCRVAARRLNNGNLKSNPPLMSQPITKRIYDDKIYTYSEMKLLPNQRVKAIKHIKWRREGNEYIICSNNLSSLIKIDKMTYMLLGKARYQGSISIYNLAQKNNLNYKSGFFRNMVERLIGKGYLILS